MHESNWTEESKRPDTAFSRTVDRVRSTHVGLPRAGGPIREWNSGVFSARTMIDDQTKSSSASSSPIYPVTPKINSAVGSALQFAPSLTEQSSSTSNSYFASQNHAEASLPKTDFTASPLFDTQTQTYSFSYIVRRIEQELIRARYFERPMAILVIAIDTLRTIPTTWGQQPKEKALEAVAISLFNSVRPVDLIGRYTDERFVILCPEMNLEAATALAENLRCGCSGTIVKHEWQDLFLSVSIGIAVAASGFDELESLLAVADIGADMAVQSGGNRSYCYQ